MRRPASTLRTQQERRESAETLAKERGLRTAEEQLKILNERLGEEQGAEKERKRLLLQIEQRQSKNINKHSKKNTGEKKRKKAKDRRNAQRKRN